MVSLLPVYAEARMTSQREGARGFVVFEQHQPGICLVTFQFSHLPPGRHALHVHTTLKRISLGDVSAGEGGVHVGRFENVPVGELSSLISHSVVLHRDPDPATNENSSDDILASGRIIEPSR